MDFFQHPEPGYVVKTWLEFPSQKFSRRSEKLCSSSTSVRRGAESGLRQARTRPRTISARPKNFEDVGRVQLPGHGVQSAGILFRRRGTEATATPRMATRPSATLVSWFFSQSSQARQRGPRLGGWAAATVLRAPLTADRQRRSFGDGRGRRDLPRTKDREGSRS